MSGVTVKPIGLSAMSYSVHNTRARRWHMYVFREVSPFENRQSPSAWRHAPRGDVRSRHLDDRVLGLGRLHDGREPGSVPRGEAYRIHRDRELLSRTGPARFGVLRKRISRPEQLQRQQLLDVQSQYDDG